MARNGFTLIELMVVIALMALMAGAVAMTIGGPGGGPADAATRFASRLAAARDSAITGGRPISPWVSASGYGFDQYLGGRWQQLTVKPFDGDDWPEGVRATTDAAPGPGRQAAPPARVRFDSIGLPDRPLTVRLFGDGRRVEVQLAANGDVSVR